VGVSNVGPRAATPASGRVLRGLALGNPAPVVVRHNRLDPPRLFRLDRRRRLAGGGEISRRIRRGILPWNALTPQRTIFLGCYSGGLSCRHGARRDDGDRVILPDDPRQAEDRHSPHLGCISPAAWSSSLPSRNLATSIRLLHRADHPVTPTGPNPPVAALLGPERQDQGSVAASIASACRP